MNKADDMNIPFQKSIRKSQGIGLLELMLTLAILGVMLIVSVRYFSNASTAQEASSLVNSFMTIKAAVENYLADNPLTTSIPTIADLVQGGYLPSSYGIKTKNKFTAAPNYWGGTITVSASAGAATFSVAQTNIPQNVCVQSMGQIVATLNQALGESAFAIPAKGSKGGASSSSSSGGGGKGVTLKNSGITCGVTSTITVTYIS